MDPETPLYHIFALSAWGRAWKGAANTLGAMRTGLPPVRAALTETWKCCRATREHHDRGRHGHTRWRQGPHRRGGHGGDHRRLPRCATPYIRPTDCSIVFIAGILFAVAILGLALKVKQMAQQLS